ncbi:hypothetical protein RTH46_23430, partial [Pseudomonas sp. zfem004]|uniref:hypothetical protein n=1 Tax=Pseudomonas sp. zfem004 TaxID=3078199 RepID=UPI00292898C1
GVWVAGTATQYNHLDHGDAKSFEASMESCGSDEVCQRDSWIKEKYAEESIYNDKSVEGVSGPMLARDKMGQIAAGLDALLAMTCTTTTCQEYKLDLIGSALANYKKLSDVAGEWSPTLDRIGMIVLGAGTVGAEGPRPRPAGTPISVGAGQVEKALEYFSTVKDSVKVVGTKGGLPPLRQAYVNEVKALEDVALNMRAAGASPEQVARQLHQMRRDLGVQYKDLTPAPQLEAIYARNIEKYGDKLGPTVDWLRAKGKSWEQIIESASRSGGKDLGF